MASGKKTVLITGCSDGGLGAALAKAFHQAGLHVIATARNPEKLKEVKASGIDTLALDVLSDESIKECVSKVESLDILVNNAGAGYSMPISDIDISEAKKLFDLNVWSYLTVTQAFLPLLLKSKGMIVHNTSIASISTVPFQATYNASKAAMAMFADTQRLELEPFGVRVVDLKTGAVSTNFFTNTLNHKAENPSTLPPDSLYQVAKDAVENTMTGGFIGKMTDADVWAKDVVSDLTKNSPPSKIWRGESAGLVRLASFLPYGFVDGPTKKMTGVDVVAKNVR